MKRRISPCIDICDFSGPNGWCLGCGRTRKECNQWKKKKPYDINRLEKELEKRLSKLNNTQAKQSFTSSNLEVCFLKTHRVKKQHLPVNIMPNRS